MRIHLNHQIIPPQINNEKFSHDCDGETEFIFMAFIDVFIDDADTLQTLLKLKTPLDYLRLISERITK